MDKHMIRCFQISFAIMAVWSIASCSFFEPQPRKLLADRLPETFSMDSQGTEKPDHWWESFGDPELNRLVGEALSDNLTIKEAWARLGQVNALAVQAGASLYPDLFLSTEAIHTRQRLENESHQGGTTETIRDYSVGLLSSYELDLWGRIRSEQQAANLEASATRQDLNAAAITLAAEVTVNWLNILSQRIQKRILLDQLETNQTYLELVELRFRKSMASALDVFQQKQIVAQVKAKIPQVEAQEALLMHELALLLGKPPRTSLSITREVLPVPPEIPSTGLPADLLTARPDVRAAGLRLHGADWLVAAARANRMPAVRLTADASYGAEEWDLLFDNWFLGIAAGLTAPLFDGKQRAAEVDRTNAVVDEKLSAYYRTVLTAIKEVEDALVSEKKQRQHIEALHEQINAAQRALNEAMERYRKGMNDYLPVLTQLLAVQGLERDIVQQQTALLIYRVNLYRALGGTWVNELGNEVWLDATGIQTTAKN